MDEFKLWLGIIAIILCFIWILDGTSRMKKPARIVIALAYIALVALLFAGLFGTGTETIDTWFGPLHVPAWALGFLLVLAPFSIVIYLAPIGAVWWAVEKIVKWAKKKKEE